MGNNEAACVSRYCDAISVIVVDDFNCVRKGLVLLLSDSAQVSIVGDAADRDSAIQLATQNAPNVILMDVYLPRREDGIETTRQLKQIAPHSRILALSGFATPEDVQSMLHAGASGFIVKTADVEEILKAIVVLYHGGTYLCSDTAALLKRRVCPNAFLLLTQKEKEIFKSLVMGMDTGEIATSHHVSLDTVATHRRNIFKKLGVDSQPRLIWFALNNRLLEFDTRSGSHFL
ncbi:MAG: response regulator transcription factor [Deltaproteobacteria bacterium]|nr:response regulator transcription factor [Deltaproteobacteria bacterium]